MKNVWIACVVLSLSSPLLAQRGAVERTPDSAAAAQLYEKIVGEVRTRMAVEAKITTGLPYSAEAITESTQALADGNRINRKSVTRIYRDGEGRTRREDVDDSGTVVSVSIVDPVAHVSYVLNPPSRTAYRDPVRIAMSADGAGGRGMVMRRSPEGGGSPATAGVQERMKVEEEARARGASPMPPPPPPPPPPGEKVAIEGTALREDLGSQNVESVSATGSRSTITITAGTIGNLQPIKIVSEQWFSPDLQVLVMTRHSDPRSGETTYRLQNIVRAEPDRSLFTVPPDYTLKESGIRPQMQEQ